MKRIFCLVAMLPMGLGWAAPEKQIGTFVSLTNLVATPERYDGKVVFVAGFISIKHENLSLCPSLKPLSSKDCVWLAIDDGPVDTDEDIKRILDRAKKLKPFHGKSGFVRGVFSQKNMGHMGMWSGAIKELTDVTSGTTRVTFAAEE